MEDQTQEQQTIESPTETQVSDTQVDEQATQASVETPISTTEPTPTNATSEEVPTVPCDCKCIHKLGYVEVALADGTKLQMTVQQAQDELIKFENIKQALEGGTENAA